MSSEIFHSVYQTMIERNTRYDGKYYVGIRTTGIVCRPSCRSRLPNPENVHLFPSVQAALEAGFRPCKRCKPETPSQHGPDAELAEAVVELIRGRYSEPLTLQTIASELIMSPYHLQRVVKRVTGLTPAKHLQQIRMEKAKVLLRSSDRSVSEVAFAVGFKNVSHFSASFKKATGSTPNEFRMQPIGG